MRLRVSRRLLLACLAAVLAVAAAVVALPALSRTNAGRPPVAVARPCPSGLARPWRCSTVTVPLDRSGRVHGRVRLAVALLHRPGPPRPAVLALAGGPGSAAIPGAMQFANRLAPLLDRRDLLVVDQRGTGVSAPIHCPSIDGRKAWSRTDVRRCAAALGPARGFQGTADSVADLQAVRRALGIPRLAVYGISYGTKVAVDYARADRRHVAALVLDSPIVQDTDPFYRRSAIGAARVLENQCGEGNCVSGADPVADLRTLVGRMRNGVLPSDPRVTQARILHVVVEGHGPLHSLPRALHAAVNGHLGRLVALLPDVVPDARNADWLRPAGSRTVYLTTSCEDGDFPWRRSTPLAARLAATRSEIDRLGDSAFAPFDRIVGVQYGAARICAAWPESGHRPTPPRLPDVPALLLVGGDDDVAPLEGAREIASELPRARVLVVPEAGHGVLGRTGPAADALRSFAAALG